MPPFKHACFLDGLSYLIEDFSSGSFFWLKERIQYRSTYMLTFVVLTTRLINQILFPLFIFFLFLYRKKAFMQMLVQ